ncbi:MAG: hypothetical protein IPL61_20030 [Myxococcales bacterium]|nr:hypothetical protein [Myxococcales bacterium]
MLHYLATLAAVLGLLAMVLGGLWMLGQAFSTSALWGLGMLIPPVAVAYVLVHWRQARDPLFLQFLGLAAVVGAALVDPSAVPSVVR